MTAAAYSTNLATIIIEFPNTTGWTAIGTGGAGLNAPETDYFIQGNNCITKNAWAGAVKGMIYDSGSDQGGSGTDGAYIMWCTHTAPNSLDTKAGGGMRFLIGSGSGAYDEYYVGGSDTNTFLKWTWAAVNEATTPDSTVGSPTAGVEQYFGMTWDLPSGGPTKGAPAAIDGIRFGRCDIICEFGTGADPEASFDGIITNFETASNRYGMLVQREPGGSFENSGLLQWGTATNPVEFLDSNKTIFLRAHDHTTANFHTWDLQNASSIITLTNIIVQSLGGQSRGRFITTDNGTLTWTNVSFTDFGTCSFDSNATLDGCTWRRCDAVTCTGDATLTNSVFDDTNVSAGNSALIWNATTDPDGNLDGSSFTKGTTDTHAIELGTGSPLTQTFRNIDWSGYVNTVASNASAFHVKRTTGTVTINIVGGSGFPGTSSYTTDGATVNIVLNPVTTLVNVKDNNGVNLQNANVYLKAKNGTGPEPFEDSVTITRSGTTATVTHTAHGMKSNDYVKIQGITDKTEDNAGAHQITVTGANTYTYTTTDSGSTSYTGSITSTFVALYGLTDANGNISLSRTFASNQPVTGFVRKASSSPRFKSFTLDDTIDSTNGLTINVRMILDE